MVDFWRMAWQLHSPTIVMMTNIHEGRKKCEQYWPQFGTADYGPYSVTLAEQKIQADYTIRKLTLTVCRCNMYIYMYLRVGYTVIYSYIHYYSTNPFIIPQMKLEKHHLQTHRAYIARSLPHTFLHAENGYCYSMYIH